MIAVSFFKAGGAGPIVMLALSIVVASSAVIKMLPRMLHVFASIVNTAEGFVGTPTNPGVIDRLKAQDGVLADVVTRVVKVETQLNGGGTIQPALIRLEAAVDKLQTDVSVLRPLAEAASVDAEQAKASATDAKATAKSAHIEAAELSSRLHESTEIAIVQRGEIIRSVDNIVADISHRERLGYERLAAAGGPDMRGLLPPHTLPTIKGDK